MPELFIYYRLDPADASVAYRAVMAFQERLQARYPWLKTRLLCRPDQTDGQQTWMEIYSADPASNSTGITPEVRAEIDLQALSIAPFVRGTRHVEVFIACAL